MPIGRFRSASLPNETGAREEAKDEEELFFFFFSPAIFYSLLKAKTLYRLDRLAYGFQKKKKESQEERALHLFKSFVTNFLRQFPLNGGNEEQSFKLPGCQDDAVANGLTRA